MEIKSYKKKNGETAYKFRVYVSKENGKDKYVKRQGFQTKAKARAALLQLQDDLENSEEKRRKSLSRKSLKNASRNMLTPYKIVPTSRQNGIYKIIFIQL